MGMDETNVPTKIESCYFSCSKTHVDGGMSRAELLKQYWIRWNLSLCFGLILLGLHTQAHAQAWTQKQGTVYIKTAYGLAVAAEQFNFEGRTAAFYNEKPGYTFADSSFYLYTEAGLLDSLTLSLALPYKRIYNETLDHRKLTVGLGDMDVRFRFSIQEFAKIPVISALSINVGATIPLNYTRNLLPTLGRGQIGLRATVDYGQSFSTKIPMYLQIGVGYQNRLPFFALTRTYVDEQGNACPSGGDINCIEDQPDKVQDAHEFVFQVEYGLLPTKWLLLQLHVMGTISFADPEATLQTPGEIPPPTQRFIHAGAIIVFYPFYRFRWAEKLGFSFQFTGTVYGQNTIRSLNMFFGLEYKIDFKQAGK